MNVATIKTQTTCTKCNGTGVFNIIKDNKLVFTGSCFTCNGTGKVDRYDCTHSAHMGNLGERLDKEVVLVNVCQYEVENKWGHSYWSSPTNTMEVFKFLDELGNVYVWKTTSGAWYDVPNGQGKQKNLSALDYGTVIRIKGTVKNHNEYRGEKQTILTRCKVVVY